MTDHEFTILEIYDIRAFIVGFQSASFFTPGFINEKNPELKESTKRLVAKVGKILSALLADIDEQRAKIQQFVPEGFVTVVSNEGKTEEEVKKEQADIDAKLAAIRKEKDDELLNSKEKVSFEMPLFSLVANLSFPNNYTLLYDKIFKD